MLVLTFDFHSWVCLCSEDLDGHDFTHYKNIMLTIETVQSHIGGVREGRCLNTIAFPADMRCLTVIMMFNLYPVKKMTTINNAKSIFLMELKENTYIDISAHIFYIFANETRTTTRAMLIFASLLMRLFKAKGVEIPQEFVFRLMKRRVIKKRENLCRLRQKLKDNHQVQEAMGKGAELHHPPQYLQMHSRSSLKGLMDSEMSRMSNLTGWLLSKSRWTSF